ADVCKLNINLMAQHSSPRLFPGKLQQPYEVGVGVPGPFAGQTARDEVVHRDPARFDELRHLLGGDVAGNLRCAKLVDTVDIQQLRLNDAGVEDTRIDAPAFPIDHAKLAARGLPTLVVGSLGDLAPAELGVLHVVESQ